MLIPGVSNKWSYLKPLGDKISLLGHPVHIVPELGQNRYPIPDSVKILRRVIEREGLERVVIVGHSKGGLIGKYYLMHENDDSRVLGIVAIASPFSGTTLVDALLRHSVSRPWLGELRSESDMIRELGGNAEVNRKIISIYPEYDTHVWAKEKSCLKGAAKNIEIRTGGHNLIISNAQAIQAVISAIEELSSLEGK